MSATAQNTVIVQQDRDVQTSTPMSERGAQISNHWLRRWRNRTEHAPELDASHEVQPDSNSTSISSDDELRRERFLSLQEWEGVVTSISHDSFSAELTDVDQGKLVAEEIADFLLEDLSDEDRSVIRVGSVFRWNIGYSVSPSGQKRRLSQIVFRRLPQWTQRELDEANEKARLIASRFEEGQSAL